MFIHCKQCAVKAHLPNGRYVIEVTIPARKKKAIKIKALTVRNFRFARFYTLRKIEAHDDNGCFKVQWLIGPCVSRI